MTVMHLRRSRATPDLIVRPLRRCLMCNSSPEKPIIQEQNGVSATFRKQWSSGSRVMTSLTTFENFAALEVQVQETRIFLRRLGAGPAVLLLHGFPQTHLMWRVCAPLLARRFSGIFADLRGYGRSSFPPSSSRHGSHARTGTGRAIGSVRGKLAIPL